MKLTIELVPQSSWYSNVRSNVSNVEWNIIKNRCSRKANHKCEICGDNGKNQGYDYDVECHEIWQYDDIKHIQKLIGFIALCPFCHKVKHSGLALTSGEEAIVIKQLMKVNNIPKKTAKEYISKSFEIWNERSNFDWKIDIEYMNSYNDLI